MNIAATFKYARISPQKMRLVANQVRGLSVEAALGILDYSPKKGAKMIKKVLLSAVANAEHNKGIDIDTLKVLRICVDHGPTYKRYRARAKGRGTRILKRSSHITVAVSDLQNEA